MTGNRKFGAEHRSADLFGADPAVDSTRSGCVTAYTDGGARGNPGPAGYGVVLRSDDGAVLAELSEFLGIRTNNVAEYSGLLAALTWAVEHGIERLRVISDSELMVKQMRGQYRVQSPELRPLYDEAKRQSAKLKAFQIEHVLRGKNKRADELANQAMDRGAGGGMKQKTGAPSHVSESRHGAPAATVRPLRGIVREGKITLLDGSLPEGTAVVVMEERKLRERAHS